MQDIATVWFIFSEISFPNDPLAAFSFIGELSQTKNSIFAYSWAYELANQENESDYHWDKARKLTTLQDITEDKTEAC